MGSIRMDRTTAFLTEKSILSFYSLGYFESGISSSAVGILYHSCVRNFVVILYYGAVVVVVLVVVIVVHLQTRIVSVR